MQAPLGKEAKRQEKPKMWTPDISEFEGPRYLALASAITQAIDSGALPPGTQLPPLRDLAKHLNVTVGTVARAYKIAKARQLVSGEVGRGTFVRGSLEDEGHPNYLPERLPGTIDFALFGTNVAGLSDAVAGTLSEAATRATLLPMHKYPPANGFPTHRTAGATWIERAGLSVEPDQVIVCNGAQQALMVILVTMAARNNVVLCERVTYSGMKALASVLGKQLKGVEIDEFGIIPKSLEAAVEETAACLVYVQPTVHNPTGAVMPEARRREIAEIAIRHRITIIEDDAAVGALRNRPAPIATYAPDNTIYLTGLSKCISPALRVGYMAAPSRLVERLANTLHAMTLANSPILAELAATLINNGAAEQLAARHLDKLAEYHAVVSARLGDVKHLSHPAAFFVWIELPDHWTSMEFCDAARRAGISVVPSDNLTASGTPPKAIRISLNPNQKVEAIEEGIDKLKRLIEERHTPPLTV